MDIQRPEDPRAVASFLVVIVTNNRLSASQYNALCVPVALRVTDDFVRVRMDKHNLILSAVFTKIFVAFTQRKGMRSRKEIILLHTFLAFGII